MLVGRILRTGKQPFDVRCRDRPEIGQLKDGS